MEQDLKYDNVVPRALTYLKEELHQKYSSCQHYHIGWRLLKAFMEEQQITILSPLVCQQYIGYLGDVAKTRELTPREIRSVKAATVMSEFISTGVIEPRRKYKYLEGSIGVLIQEYLLSKSSMRLSANTIRQIERNLSRFNFWLATESIYDISELKHERIIRFIQHLDPSKKGYVHVLLAHLKGFLKYLYEKRVIGHNMSAAIPKDHYRSMSKLPSCYSENEIGQMLHHVDRGIFLGKRDYAVILLTVHLGMRASDIAALQFDNLDWDKNVVRFQQQKGGAVTSLPLLAVIGNAILDYLQYGRPKSCSPRVFLVHRTPYPPIGSATVGDIVRRRLRGAGINLKGRRSGSHAMRHSLVKQLLDSGRSLPVISEVLGHGSQESTRHYIRIDLNSLRKCTLPVPAVTSGFYEQDDFHTLHL